MKSPISDDSTAKATEFFESYRAVFEQFDTPAIADHFAYPCHLTSDADEIGLSTVATKQDWMVGLERLLQSYKVIGVSTARVLDLQATAISPRLLQAVIHWELYNAEGSALYDFHAMYTLGMIDNRLRIVALAHDEIPRLRKVLGLFKAASG